MIIVYCALLLFCIIYFAWHDVWGYCTFLFLPPCVLWYRLKVEILRVNLYALLTFTVPLSVGDLQSQKGFSAFSVVIWASIDSTQLLQQNMLQQNVGQSLCCKELRVSSKISVLPSETFSETLGLENFTTASRSHCEQNSSSSSAVAELYPREAVLAWY